MLLSVTQLKTNKNKASHLSDRQQVLQTRLQHSDSFHGKRKRERSAIPPVLAERPVSCPWPWPEQQWVSRAALLTLPPDMGGLARSSGLESEASLLTRSRRASVQGAGWPTCCYLCWIIEDSFDVLFIGLFIYFFIFVYSLVYLLSFFKVYWVYLRFVWVII